jgi:hypothetical protein
VSLSTSYAFGDSFGQKHSLHRTIRAAPVLYTAYAGRVTGYQFSQVHKVAGSRQRWDRCHERSALEAGARDCRVFPKSFT